MSHPFCADDKPPYAYTPGDLRRTLVAATQAVGGGLKMKWKPRQLTMSYQNTQHPKGFVWDSEVRAGNPLERAWI